MTGTDIALILSIALALAYAIYDEFIMDRLKGETRLRVSLKRVNRLDALIFIGLVIILIYRNVMNNGAIITTSLLLSLAFMAIYLAYIRRPKLLFKSTGFFYANIFILYNRIKNMNLSEDGILVIDLEKRRLLIQVNQLDDLEKIYKFMVENQ
ncbi:hypothetical protein BIY26_01500 [Brenneria goodwinii]|uniref:UPF0266 membrane protein BIY26_01500 n=1 Tax=Brenneria goodwinii TaxID=1109412 RepID=A0A0G4K0Q1_9GAMM|nr:DUF986 family protein [Brenneria goodwinii]ATA24099.1 hypothetical protein AWC36_08235 [Brenneria goodwinii]MCG8155311.1 DUF986 domain-containing protein [Brenneria goodwinii]MCG8159555.1 DUF986 domain-containing protein [Brenneria goodwinii]MCG8164276.1 DUF986 domain-containing protein [Brenneria goodwinii]MCG8169158.1 DUF986 domain-containing protein [Brenneria goodwinii]